MTWVRLYGNMVIEITHPTCAGKGGHELSDTTGNAGARVACGEIVKTEALQANVQASVKRSNFATQSSSFLSRARMSAAPDDNDEDPFAGDDPFQNDLEPLGEDAEAEGAPAEEPPAEEPPAVEAPAADTAN